MKAFYCICDRHGLEHERRCDEAKSGEENEQKTAQNDARVVEGLGHCERSTAHDQVKNVDESNLYESKVSSLTKIKLVEFLSFLKATYNKTEAVRISGILD